MTTKTDQEVRLADAPPIPGLHFRTFDPDRDYEGLVALMREAHLLDGFDWIPTVEILRTEHDHAGTSWREVAAPAYPAQPEGTTGAPWKLVQVWSLEAAGGAVWAEPCSTGRRRGPARWRSSTAGPVSAA